MKKGLKIVGFFAVLLVFVACEKCDKPVLTEDPFVNSTSTEDQDDNTYINRAGEGDGIIIGSTSNDGDGSITDPNEDEDYDDEGIVDPEEDEDFEGEEEGK